MIVSITNNKGGCGKTTTAANLGAALRLRGFDVLAVDLDGQANLTLSFGMVAFRGCSTYDAMKRPAAPYIPPLRVLEPEQGAGVLDILPADSDLSACEVELSNQTDRVTRLGAFLKQYTGKYDFIIIDTPPALGLLTISALFAADAVIITVQPQYLAVQGLISLTETVRKIDAARGIETVSRVLFTQYDGRKGLHRLTVEEVRNARFPAFQAVIRENVALGEAPAVGLDIFRYAPRSKGAADYTAVCAEFLTAAKVRHRSHGYRPRQTNRTTKEQSNK